MERAHNGECGTQRHSLLPDSGAESRHRVRASGTRRRSLYACSHDVSRSHERLRPEAHNKTMKKTLSAAILILLSFRTPGFMHRLDLCAGLALLLRRTPHI